MPTHNIDFKQRTTTGFVPIPFPRLISLNSLAHLSAETAHISAETAHIALSMTNVLAYGFADCTIVWHRNSLLLRHMVGGSILKLHGTTRCGSSMIALAHNESFIKKIISGKYDAVYLATSRV